jgi:hypothetical protein
MTAATSAVSTDLRVKSESDMDCPPALTQDHHLLIYIGYSSRDRSEPDRLSMRVTGAVLSLAFSAAFRVVRAQEASRRDRCHPDASTKSAIGFALVLRGGV